MRATGIVRRIDDFGRIAIPKEVRRSLYLKEGTPMEIFLGDDKVIFKPYSPLEMEDVVPHVFVNNIFRCCEKCVRVYVTDTRKIIRPSHGDCVRGKLSDNFIACIENRNLGVYQPSNVKIADCDTDYKAFSQIIVPILADGELVGSIVARYPRTTELVCMEKDVSLLQFAASMIAERMK